MGLAMAGLKRTKTGRWYGRKEIPADVREAYGKREEKRTWPAELSPGAAKAELAAWLGPIEDRITFLRGAAQASPLHLSKRQCRALAGEWYAKQVARFEDDPGLADRWDEERWSLRPEDDEEAEAGRYNPPPYVVAERDALVREKGLTLAPAAADALLQEMCDVWAALCDLMERRAHGDYGPDRLAETFPEFAPTAAKNSDAASAAVSINDLFEAYAASGTAAPATIKKWRTVIRSFVEFMGHDDAARVTVANINGWVAALLAKPLSVKTIRDGYQLFGSIPALVFVAMLFTRRPAKTEANS